MLTQFLFCACCSVDKNGIKNARQYQTSSELRLLGLLASLFVYLFCAILVCKPRRRERRENENKGPKRGDEMLFSPLLPPRVEKFLLCSHLANAPDKTHFHAVPQSSCLMLACFIFLDKWKEENASSAIRLKATKLLKSHSGSSARTSENKTSKVKAWRVCNETKHLIKKQCQLLNCIQANAELCNNICTKMCHVGFQ